MSYLGYSPVPPPRDSLEVFSFTGDGIKTNFQLNKPIDIEANVSVNIQGVIQHIDGFDIGADNTSIDLPTAPDNGDKIEIKILGKVHYHDNLLKPSGLSRPAHIGVGEIWSDLDYDTDKLALYVYDGTNDILINVIDKIAHSTDRYSKSEIDANTYTKTYIDANTYTRTYIDANTIGDIVDDTSPQLGGALDCNSKHIKKSSYAQIADSTPGSGTTDTLDYSAGDMKQVTCPSGGTLTFATINFPPGGACAFILDLVNGGACTLILPVGWLYAGGTKPTFTVAGTDRLLITKDKYDVYTLSVVALDIKVSA